MAQFDFMTVSLERLNSHLLPTGVNLRTEGWLGQMKKFGCTPEN
jgi:hypothetical protein